MRLAAFDLDGTLLNRDNRIGEANADALHALIARGVVCAPATARGYRAAMRLFAEHGITPAAIASGGADVRLADGTVVQQLELPGGFVHELAAIADRERWNITFVGAERTLRRQAEVPDWLRDSPRPGIEIVPELAGANLSGLLTALVEADPGHIALSALDGWREEVATKTAITFSGHTLITFTNAAADKGTALKALCAALEIDPSQAVAFGDSEVDLPMFAVAGIAVAMANGTEEAKAASTHIAPPADEDGVARMVDELSAES